MKIPKLPERQKQSHKGSYGKLLIIAGSRGMIGAACLSAKSALRSGCGLVYLAMPETAQKIAAAQVLSALTIPLPETTNGSISAKAFEKIRDVIDDKDCIAIGPGLSTDSETVKFVLTFLSHRIDVPIVIDADGLNALAQNPEILEKVCTINTIVLTPHPGEFARLMNSKVSDVQKNRDEFAEKFSTKYPDTTLVLKGHNTIIRQNDKKHVNSTGNAGLAKGGTGDVLTGLIAGFIAQKMSIFDASVLSAYLHGLAGELTSNELTQYCMTAEDLITFLPNAFKKHNLSE